MKKWAVVYKDTATSWLVKWYGDHYEVEASGETNALQKIADELNGEKQ